MADKATVISIVPFLINESKPGLYPGNFYISPAAEGDFEFLVVTRAVHHVYLDSDRGSLTIPTTSDEIARSICDDYKKAQLAYGANTEPGLFWIEGEYKDKKAILAVAADKIADARRKQRNWFTRLVEIADDEWNKYHSHKMVSDLQRYAAKNLGLEREWNIQGTVASTSFCPACRSIVSNEALVCATCRTILKMDEYKKRGIVQAGV